MTQIAFMSALQFQGPKSLYESALETVDDYFHLGGEKAHILRLENGKEKAIFYEEKVSSLAYIGKIASYFTPILPLMLLAKTMLRKEHVYEVIDARKELEEGMDIPKSTLEKVQTLFSKVRSERDHPDIIWLHKGNNLVFKLKESPGLVFKYHPLWDSSIMNKRFNNMIKAKAVCLEHNLDLLIVPHAKKVEVDFHGVEQTLIVEEELGFDQDDRVQEESYRKCSLSKTIRQLATFIAKTGLNDVTPRNIPLLGDRVCLIDLEHMDNARGGFEGEWNGSEGLINCISKELINVVILEAKRNGIAVRR